MKKKWYNRLTYTFNLKCQKRNKKKLIPLKK
jgi:hypothetical protein